MRRAAGFTLMELLIVITLLGVLYLTVVRSFIGFNAEARVVATKTAVDTLRSTVQLFRAKEGRYPESLGELLSETYRDVGVERTYMRRLPPEQVTGRANDTYEDLQSSQTPRNDGGWNYFTDTAEVAVDQDKPLGRTWDEAEGEVPAQW